MHTTLPPYRHKPGHWSARPPAGAQRRNARRLRGHRHDRDDEPRAFPGKQHRSDRLARWHSQGGRTVVLLAVVHAAAAVIGWSVVDDVNPAAAALEVLRMPGLLAATQGTAGIIAVAFFSARARRRRLGYERWHALHLSLYVAVALTFTHQLAGPCLVGDLPAQLARRLLYAYAFGLVLRYRLLAPLQQLWRHRLCVHCLVREGDGVVSIVLRGRHLEELCAEPGQFFRRRFLTRATWASAHPFSLRPAAWTVAPGDGQGSGRREPQPAAPATRHPGPGRRAVRGDDRPAADPPEGVAHRRWCGHHADARPSSRTSMLRGPTSRWSTAPPATATWSSEESSTRSHGTDERS